MRTKIRSLVEKAGWEVAGEAASGQECIDRIKALAPELAIVELSMPVKSAIEVAAEIRKFGGPTKLLVVTVHDSDAIREEVLRAGADGFAVKSSSTTQLLAEARRLLGEAH
jgi:DNA-binding NarL/FixJ family response regulator